LHARTLLSWIAVVASVLWAVSFAGAQAARYVVRHSGFRLAVAASGAAALRDKKLDVAIGNSQFMDGLSADEINAQRKDVSFVNLAFNGLESPDVLAVLSTFYTTCECNVARLYVNAGALEDESPGTSEVEIFMAAFNPELTGRILSDKPSLRWSLRAFPLLHFNNEVFHRSVYYWLKGGNDQGHGNDYHFRLPKVAPNRLGGVQKMARLDTPRLRALVELTRKHSTTMTVIVPPFHPVYVQNRVGFSGYVSQVRELLAPYGIPVLDHSAGIVATYDGFADLIHLNLEGQSLYSRFFAADVIPAGAARTLTSGGGAR